MDPITLSNGATLSFASLASDATLVFGGVIAVTVLVAGFYLIRRLINGVKQSPLFFFNLIFSKAFLFFELSLFFMSFPTH